MQKVIKEGKYTGKIINKEQYGDKYLIVIKGLDKEILLTGNKEIVKNKVVELISLLTEIYIQLD
jgi:hypothetical protein